MYFLPCRNGFAGAIVSADLSGALEYGGCLGKDDTGEDAGTRITAFREAITHSESAGNAACISECEELQILALPFLDAPRVHEELRHLFAAFIRRLIRT
jgi:hypothetical protein